MGVMNVLTANEKLSEEFPGMYLVRATLQLVTAHELMLQTMEANAHRLWSVNNG